MINYTLDCVLYYKSYITLQMQIIYIFFASAEYWSQIIITSVYYSSLYFVNYYFCIINLYKISAKRFQSASTWIMPL